MFNNFDYSRFFIETRRKLQLLASSPSDRARGADNLHRRVLIKNSINLADSVNSSTSSESSPVPASHPPPAPTPQPTGAAPSLEPLQTDSLFASSTLQTSPTEFETAAHDTVADGFVFPDATSIGSNRVHTAEENAAQERWLDALLGSLTDSDSDSDSEDGELEDEANSLLPRPKHDHEPEDDAESLAWLLSTEQQQHHQPTISVPSPTSVPVRPLSPPHGLPYGPLELPFYYPLPDDSDDDLSTPGMEEDIEGESEADSIEWPTTPGPQYRSTASLGRCSYASSLNHLIACASASEEPEALTAAEPSHIALPALREGDDNDICHTPNSLPSTDKTDVRMHHECTLYMTREQHLLASRLRHR